MTNLENLRKQTKQFLCWHHDRYYPVAAEIRAVLPRFSSMTDAQVLAAPFTLGDAQELVARRLGYENWQALKSGVSEMSNSKKPTHTTPVLSATEAMLYVSNFRRAHDFYLSKLGFVTEFVYGEPPFYGLVRRDRARLCLRLVWEPVFVGDIRERQELLSAALTVDGAAEIKELFRVFQAAGVEFFRKLKQQPWGARDFIVRDPDGNLLLFAGPSD
jgi:catechol 2,3-dioxygenase-like lactoylglutathione lyase family enzyme